MTETKLNELIRQLFAIESDKLSFDEALAIENAANFLSSNKKILSEDKDSWELSCCC